MFIKQQLTEFPTVDLKLIALHENKAHLESVAATLNTAANKLLRPFNV
ncbi:hypothetical protein [Vibrio phage J14]|nr:hypothetical protein [Vibrio phage J14]